jgi:hypothetical protein
MAIVLILKDTLLTPKRKEMLKNNSLKKLILKRVILEMFLVSKKQNILREESLLKMEIEIIIKMQEYL